MNSPDLPIPLDRFVVRDSGLRRHYLDLGEGPVVVWLHGSGPGASGYSNFKGNYPAFAAAGFRNIVLDLPGFGRSDKPADVQYNLDFFVTSLNGLLQKIGVTKCTLLGNSLGGAIALQFALDYPQMTEKLVLMAPGGLNAKEEYFQMPGMQKMGQVFSSGQAVTPEVMKDLFASSLMHDPRHATDALIAERMEIMQKMNSQVMATMKVPELTERLQEIKAPVLGFWGLNERMMPESGIMKLARNTPDIRLVLVSNCGHWVMVEHQDMFNRMTHDFLAHG